MKTVHILAFDVDDYNYPVVLTLRDSIDQKFLHWTHVARDFDLILTAEWYVYAGDS
jgi:hypothetical protein